MIDLPSVSQTVASRRWRNGVATNLRRALPEETPVVLSYDKVGFAVMLATPADLADFAVGFSLSEGIIAAPSDITGLQVVAVDDGIECRMTLVPVRRDALESRRRRIAGPVGCGLCGIETLQQAVRPLPQVRAPVSIPAARIVEMVAAMTELQALNRETSGVHAAGFFSPAHADPLLREDVGRHNALDKLIGAAASCRTAPEQGVICLTSRVSIELIQKTAMFGVPILVAVSVPTARAVRAAEACGITLVAVARNDGFEIFSHPDRIGIP